MIKAKIIFGSQAVNQYEEEGLLKNENNIDGHVDEVEFRTREELDAYNKGLEDADGWEKTLSLDATYTNTPDCDKCPEWREYFEHKGDNMHCPFCRKLLSEPKFETITFNGHDFNVRILDNAGDLSSYKISTENLNDMLLDDGEYVSEEARYLDESIMFYVPLDKITLSDIQLALYIKCNIR